MRMENLNVVSFLRIQEGGQIEGSYATPFGQYYICETRMITDES